MTFQNENRRAGGTAVHEVLSSNRQDPNSKSPAAAAQAFVITNARLVGKNSLIGTFDVEMSSGLIVRGAMLLEKNDVRWINFPSKEWIKPDGTKGYFPLLEFASRGIQERFQALVLPLVEKAFAQLQPAAAPSKQERQRGHWSGPDDGPNDDIGF
jgi:hypothetical protein